MSSALEHGDRTALLKNDQQKRLLYEQWVQLYAPELFRFAYRLSGQRHIAEDLLQETFVEAWRSLHKQKYADKARAWLYQILRYRYTHFLRDNRHHRSTASLPPTYAHASDLAQHPLDKMAEQDALQAALNTISPMLRETFLMVFAQGLSCREAAEELHIPLGTVLSRLDGARRTLRAQLSCSPDSPAGESAI